MTLNSKFLQILQNEDFHNGMLSADSETRSILATVVPEDIDTLIERLTAVRPLIADMREAKKQEAIKLLQEAIGASTSFNSVEDVLAALNGTSDAPASKGKTKTPKAKNKNSTSTSTNQNYRISLFDADMDERREYTITNSIMPPSLLKDPVYVAVVKKNPELEDVHEFLRAYSPEYAARYPINAKWNKKEFHVGDRGPLKGKKAQQCFEEFKKENPTGEVKEFRQLAKDTYQKVK